MTKQIKKFGPLWPRKMLQIAWDNKMPVVEILRNSSNDLFRMFSSVLMMDDPAKSPNFVGLQRQCKNLETYMLKVQPERYDCLLKGKIEELPQNDFGMYALILVMSGFCSYKTEDIEKAKTYYKQA